MALKGKRARWVAGLNGRREYENIFLLWQNKEFLETEVFKEYQARIAQMGVLYVPIMVLSIFAAGSALTHPVPSPEPGQHRGTGPAFAVWWEPAPQLGSPARSLSPNPSRGSGSARPAGRWCVRGIGPQGAGGVRLCWWKEQVASLVLRWRVGSSTLPGGKSELSPLFGVSGGAPDPRVSHLPFAQHHDSAIRPFWGARELGLGSQLVPRQVLGTRIAHRRVRVGRARAPEHLGSALLPPCTKTLKLAFLTPKNVFKWLPLLSAVIQHLPVSWLGFKPCFPSPVSQTVSCSCAPDTCSAPRVQLCPLFPCHPPLSKILFS